MTRFLPAMFAVVGFVLISCGQPQAKEGLSNPSGPPADPNNAATPVQDKKKADFVVTAEALLKEFSTDPKAADTKFKGKIIDVTGRMHRHEDWKIFQLETLKTDEKKGIEISVRCAVIAPQFRLVTRFSQGQRIQMVGEYQGFDERLGPTIFGTAAEAEPTKIETVAAVDLAKEFEDDPEKASKKYDRKVLVITGKLLERGRETGKETKAGRMADYAKLAGTGKTAIRVLIPGFWLQPFENIEKGQVVEIRIHSLNRDATANEIAFNDGLLVPAK